MDVRKQKSVCLIVCVVFLTACSLSAADRYSDFLADNDVLMRLGICFDDVEHGRDTFYTVGELETLIEDLEWGYAIEDRNAEKATRLFQECSQLLIDYLESEERAEEEYINAKAYFAAATEMANEVRGA